MMQPNEKKSQRKRKQENNAVNPGTSHRYMHQEELSDKISSEKKRLKEQGESG